LNPINIMKMIKVIPSSIALLACASSGHAASLILASEGAWNGFEMRASLRSGFRQAGTAAGVGQEVSVSETGMSYVTPGAHEAGEVVMVTSDSSGEPLLSVSSTPDQGKPKDVAQGSISASFTVGSQSSDDTFSFNIDTLTSAELAQVDFGGGLENADAFFEASITLRTWAPATIPGAVIQLPTLPDLINPAPSVENMTAAYSSFVGGAPVSQEFVAGDSGELVGLHLSEIHERFEYTITYSIVTPYLTDPITSYSFSGGAAATIPEPGTTLLLSSLAAGLFRRRRA